MRSSMPPTSTWCSLGRGTSRMSLQPSSWSAPLLLPLFLAAAVSPAAALGFLLLLLGFLLLLLGFLLLLLGFLMLLLGFQLRPLGFLAAVAVSFLAQSSY